MGETYPFGLYEDEPGGVEILQRKAYRTMYGPNHLAIKHTCPACGGMNTEWVRREWSICYTCEIAFEGNERYYDLTEEECIEPASNDPCYICLTLRGAEENTYGVARSVLYQAKYAVREEEVLRLLCTIHMEEFYGMHETVLLLADTYIDKTEEDNNEYMEEMAAPT